MKAAYADPPYLGLAAKFYGSLHPNAADYDDPETHRRLIERLSDDFDCWSMSLHVPSLKTIIGMCPDDVRIGVWVKPFASFKLNVTRAWTWEPVLFRFHRPRTRQQGTWRDHISEPITLRRGFTGAKPEAVCFWIFEGLNLEPDDDFQDLFPGSGAVGAAWERWKNRSEPTQLELAAEA
jgi:hypothetical protein